MDKMEINNTQTNEQSWTDYLPDVSANVSTAERVASAVTGGALLAYGIKRGDWMGTLLSIAGTTLAFRGATGYCPAYDSMGVDTSEKSFVSQGIKQTKAWFSGQKVEVVKSVTIDKSPAELYSFWHNFENLPQFMNHLESVKVLDAKRSEWTAKAPLGSEVTWNAVISEDRENELIAWTSYGDSEIKNSGRVEFQPTADRGTKVKVTINYEPPAGKIGALFAKLFGEEPEIQVAEDLRRFKRLMETGSIISIEGQTSGRAESAKTAKA